jgi:hypothetical protein
MVRERRRDDTPPVPQEVGAGVEMGCFRVMGASGNMIVDDAGLDVTALEDTEELRGRSHGAVFCRRRDEGLI